MADFDIDDLCADQFAVRFAPALPPHAFDAGCALPLYGSLAAAWYWSMRGLNGLADAGNFVYLTRRINGSLDGEADREVYWRRAQRVFTPVVA